MNWRRVINERDKLRGNPLDLRNYGSRKGDQFYKTNIEVLHRRDIHSEFTALGIFGIQQAIQFLGIECPYFVKLRL